MGAVMELKGQNGKITLHEDFLEISRKTFGGFMSQGGASGDRRYYFHDIRGVEYKKPGLINGYIKVMVAGSEDTNAKVGLFRTSKSSMEDQNTVVLRSFGGKKGRECDEMYNQIMVRIDAVKKTPAGVQQSSSKMDELSKMAELRKNGVLTEEEFQKEKSRLLS